MIQEVTGNQIVAPCELHLHHFPDFTYCEAHHIIPQAWQAVWKPPGFSGGWPLLPEERQGWPFADRSPDRSLVLWDARTINICRTGHGNLHWWLMALMHVMNDTDDLNLHTAQITVRRHSGGKRIAAGDIRSAVLAVERFTAAGGDLQKLWASHEFGAI